MNIVDFASYKRKKFLKRKNVELVDFLLCKAAEGILTQEDKLKLESIICGSKKQT